MILRRARSPAAPRRLGLGAQMVALKFGLLGALLQGAVYHFPTTHYTNPLRCASRSFDCYFEAPTNCTRDTHKRAVDVGIRWCFDVPSSSQRSASVEREK